MKKIIKNKQISLFLRGLALTTVLSCFVFTANAQIVVDENTAWNNQTVRPVGVPQSNFYAQSFYANEPYLTKIGVVLGENTPEGEVLLSIVPANSQGKPDLTNVLHQGPLINPTTTSTWYYENMHIRVNVGQKYFILIDGYNNAGATGTAYVGLSSSKTDTRENMFYTNDGGAYWANYGQPIAVYVEGTTTPVPVSIWSIVAAFAALIVTSFFVVRKKLAY